MARQKVYYNPAEGIQLRQMLMAAGDKEDLAFHAKELGLRKLSGLRKAELAEKIANELLDINEIKASFVLTEYNDKIYVSARSIDEINVQVIMERLGGGGHLNASGAQFNHTNMKEAVACLKEVIDEMIKGGDI